MRYRAVSVVVCALVLIAGTSALSANAPNDAASPKHQPPKTTQSATGGKAALPVFLELGSDECKACKQMKPVLEALRKECAGKLEVRFVDIFDHPEVAERYDILSIPTQVFLDPSGKELYRHEGFIPKREIIAKWRELGYEVAPEAPTEEEQPPAPSSLEATLKRLITGGGIAALLGAFLGGLLTALNPCVLATVPLIVGFVGGQSQMSLRKSFLYTMVFVLGFAIELALLFTVMASVAPWLKGRWMSYVVAAICIVMGLHFLEVLRIPGLVSQQRLPKVTGLLGALAFGFIYGLISLPCTGPALVLILSIIPLKGALFGGALLVLYGLGNCALLVVAGTSVGAARGIMESRGAQMAANILKKVAACLLILLGFYIIYRT